MVKVRLQRVLIRLTSRCMCVCHGGFVGELASMRVSQHYSEH